MSNRSIQTNPNDPLRNSPVERDVGAGHEPHVGVEVHTVPSLPCARPRISEPAMIPLKSVIVDISEPIPGPRMWIAACLGTGIGCAISGAPA